MTPPPGPAATSPRPAAMDAEAAATARPASAERWRPGPEDWRRALLHVLGELNRANQRLTDQRRALLHVLADSQQSTLRLAANRKAMLHLMGDLRQTTAEVERRETELQHKQEQLVQAGKLATLGELATGVAHELNNPLNNIGLFIGNVIDMVQFGRLDPGRVLGELESAMRQVRKATEIISHLRTFGRSAPATREPVSIRQVVERALALVHEQLRLRDIEVRVDWADDAVVVGSPIQLEQVFVNLLTNARDAVAQVPEKAIRISCTVGDGVVAVVVRDSGPGIPAGLERRVFDPFFTTKEVGRGTGLGLSITYGIVRDHGGTIAVISRPGEGAAFLIELPLAPPEP
ncbi:MAG TPA: ATP-binding protein [Methylomirabilota bacterium]|nr:ATP-binding protein [Methylomirabilota bacterium]